LDEFVAELETAELLEELVQACLLPQLAAYLDLDSDSEEGEAGEDAFQPVSEELKEEAGPDEAVQKLALVTLKLGSSEEECDDQVEDDKWQDDEDDPAPSPATRLWRASLVALTAFRLAAPVGPHAVGVLADNVDAIDLSDADACEAVHEVAPPSAAAWPTPPP
jgi:hypothetical protein